MRRYNTKNLILKKSIQLFGEVSYERVSVRQIATAVGIKESSIYNHYQSKEEILDDIMDYFREQHTLHWITKDFFYEKLKTQPFEEVLYYYFYNYEDEDYNEMINMFRILFMEQYRKERFKKLLLDFLIERQVQYLKEMFECFIADGYLRPFDCDGIARIWNNNNLMLAMEACHIPREETNSQHLYELCVGMIMQYATEKGRAMPCAAGASTRPVTQGAIRK